MEYGKVNIPKPTMERLIALQHKGQTIAGVIEELLDKVAPEPARSEDVRLIDNQGSCMENKGLIVLKESDNGKH